jgi:hypothetical protein
VILRPNSRSCRTASIRSGIAGGLAGKLGICASEIGVQYQPDGRLSTFPKNTATFTGKLLIVPDCAHNACTEIIYRYQCLFVHSNTTCEEKSENRSWSVEAHITPPRLSVRCAPVVSYLSGGRIS